MMVAEELDDEPVASDERSGAAVGCVLSLGSALLTCLLLFLNGSLVMAVLSVISRSAGPWARQPGIMQFLLLAIPVLMTLAEWKMIDYVRTRIGQRSTE